MICSETIKIQSRDYEYLKVDMYRAPLVMLKGKTGYVMCGYLNIEAAGKSVNILGSDLHEIIVDEDEIIETALTVKSTSVNKNDESEMISIEYAISKMNTVVYWRFMKAFDP